jgi:hypothetical protein
VSQVQLAHGQWISVNVSVRVRQARLIQSQQLHTLMTLTYNVRWIEHTFTSPAVTEPLLAQERESGNITTNDYEAAIHFFPGPNRRYCVRLFILPRFQSTQQLFPPVGWWPRRDPYHICFTQARLVQHSYLPLYGRLIPRWCCRRPYDVHKSTPQLCPLN